MQSDEKYSLFYSQRTMQSSNRTTLDRYEKNIVAEGYGVSSAEGPPIGLMFQPYYQFPSGLGVGVGLGPMMIVMGDRSFLDVPVSVDARYSFIPDGNISPYIRTGVKKHIVSGDYVNGSSVGVFGGAGVEFFRKKRVGMGIEFLIDKSNVEFEAPGTKTYTYTSGGRSYTSTIPTPVGTGREKIEPSKFLLSISAIF